MHSKSSITNRRPTPRLLIPRAGGPGPPRFSGIASSTFQPFLWELIPHRSSEANFLRPEEFPLTTVTGANYDSRRITQSPR